MRCSVVFCTTILSLALSACLGGSGGGDAAVSNLKPTSVGPAGTDNTVNATPSAASMAVAIGGSQTVGINFVTSDGKPASGLTVDLSILPAEWSEPCGNYRRHDERATAGYAAAFSFARTLVFEP